MEKIIDTNHKNTKNTTIFEIRSDNNNEKQQDAQDFILLITRDILKSLDDEPSRPKSNIERHERSRSTRHCSSLFKAPSYPTAQSTTLTNKYFLKLKHFSKEIFDLINNITRLRVSAATTTTPNKKWRRVLLITTFSETMAEWNLNVYNTQIVKSLGETCTSSSAGNVDELPGVFIIYFNDLKTATVPVQRPQADNSGPVPSKTKDCTDKSIIVHFDLVVFERFFTFRNICQQNKLTFDRILVLENSSSSSTCDGDFFSPYNTLPLRSNVDVSSNDSCIFADQFTYYNKYKSNIIYYKNTLLVNLLHKYICLKAEKRSIKRLTTSVLKLNFFNITNENIVIVFNHLIENCLKSKNNDSMAIFICDVCLKRQTASFSSSSTTTTNASFFEQQPISTSSKWASELIPVCGQEVCFIFKHVFKTTCNPCRLSQVCYDNVPDQNETSNQKNQKHGGEYDSVSEPVSQTCYNDKTSSFVDDDICEYTYFSYLFEKLARDVLLLFNNDIINNINNNNLPVSCSFYRRARRVVILYKKECKLLYKNKEFVNYLNTTEYLMQSFETTLSRLGFKIIFRLDDFSFDDNRTVCLIDAYSVDTTNNNIKNSIFNKKEKSNVFVDAIFCINMLEHKEAIFYEWFLLDAVKTTTNTTKFSFYEPLNMF